MPVAGPAIALGAAVGGAAIGGVGGAIVAIGGGVVASIVSSHTGRRDRSAARSGHQINTRSSREPLPIAYGQFRIGVNKTFYHVVNPYLHIIAELGEGQINGIVREDDSIYTATASQLPSDNPPLVYLDEEVFTKYGDLVYLEFFNGSSTQNVCSTLQTATQKWDQALRYTAYLYVRLRWDADKFNSEPDIKVLIQGAKIYNPISGNTEYTNNPALCAYDFLTRSSQRGGLGISADRIDETSLDSAINYCDTKGWICNMPIMQNQPAADNLSLIFNNFRGDIIQSGSKFKIKFRDLNYEPVVMSLSEDDVVQFDDGFSTLNIDADFTGRPNAIRATHLSEEKNYKSDDIVISDSAAIVADGDYREEPIEVFGLSDPEYAQKMSNYWLERRRLKKTISLVAGSRTMALEPLDLVNFDHTMPGWENKLLRVIKAQPNGNHTVSLVFDEEYETFYDDTYNLTAHDFDDTDLPGPLDPVPSVINVSQQEEVYYYRNRSFTRWVIDFDAPAAVNYPWWDYAEIWLKVGTDGEWRYMTRCNTNYMVDPVEEGETYFLKVRSVSVFGAKEDFDNCTTLSATIVGPAGGPPNITGLIAIANGDSVSIYGTPLDVPDIEGYEIRLGAAWIGGIFVSFNKNISLRLNGVRPGTHTFWAAAKDNAGNYSPAPVSATVTVFIPPGFTQLTTYGSWAWDFTTGTHDNTEHDTYDSEDALKCSHTSNVLTGQWTSPTYDLNAIEKVRVWGDFRIFFESAATTWDGVLPLAHSGSDLIQNGGFSSFTSGAFDNWTAVNCVPVVEPSGHTGQAAELNVSAAKGGHYQTVTVVAEAYYVVRGYYKNQSDSTCKILVYDASNFEWITITEGFELASSTNEYDPFGYIFKAPAGCTSVRIWLAASDANDVVYYDTVSMYRIDESLSTLWEIVDPNTEKNWNDLFAPPAAAQMKATLRFKEDSGDPWVPITFFELLCAEVQARYLSVIVEITDPSADANLYLKELNMLAYEGPQ